MVQGGRPTVSLSDGNKVAVAVAISSSSAVEDSASKSQIEKVNRMAEETKQSKEICNGYLEMLNWDYDAALTLYYECSR